MSAMPDTAVAPPTPPRPAADRRLVGTILPYLAIARPDHWFKNVFMVLGLVLAFFCHPELLHAHVVWSILWAVATTCVVASSNYVLNEVLDAPTDRSHPVKKNRPVPSGQVLVPVALAEWVALGVLGLAMASALNWPFFYSSLFLLVMGCVYNIPPVRSKDLPYLDVISESVNNPIRLLLGWFAVAPNDVPPVSLLIAYWMVGAFFMASKRFAEYRSIGQAEVAGAYRKSFRGYTEEKLLVSMFFYTTAFALFLGVFIIRYHLELILIVPLVAGFVSYYLHISFKPQSAVQNPERLYRETGLMAYLVLCVVAFSLLMFVRIPALYSLFNVVPSAAPALWKF
ncbi:MAG: UbiA prenyltransferase family protein [Gemmataceae bacterium]